MTPTYTQRSCLQIAATVVVIATGFVLRASAQQTPKLNRAEPAEIGLSADALNNITAYLQKEFDDGRIAGAVAAVSRHGRVGYLHAVGHSDPATKQPMETDSLFRFASMTKAITSAAVMSLVEDGVVTLDDPLSKFLPCLLYTSDAADE